MSESSKFMLLQEERIYSKFAQIFIWITFVNFYFKIIWFPNQKIGNWYLQTTPIWDFTDIVAVFVTESKFDVLSISWRSLDLLLCFFSSNIAQNGLVSLPFIFRARMKWNARTHAHVCVIWSVISASFFPLLLLFWAPCRMRMRVCKFYLHNLLSFLFYTFEHNWKKESCFIQEEKKRKNQMRCTHFDVDCTSVGWMALKLFFLSLFIFLSFMNIWIGVFRLRFFYYFIQWICFECSRHIVYIKWLYKYYIVVL